MSNFAKLKAAKAAPVTVKADKGDKGPLVRLKATHEDGCIVLRIPLTYEADLMRMTKLDPSAKKTVEKPYFSIVAELPDSLPVTIVDGNDRETVYSRRTITTNLFTALEYVKPPKSADSDSDGDDD